MNVDFLGEQYRIKQNHFSFLVNQDAIYVRVEMTDNELTQS